LKHPISITGFASISPLGSTESEIWNNYKLKTSFFSKKNDDWIAPLSDNSKEKIKQIRQSNSKYKQLDDTVVYGIYVAREAIKNAKWKATNNCGINVGSSRGATDLYETYYKSFLDNNRAETLTSPTTTLGNISSWIAHDIQTKGPTVSHSITCSTALHALLNGVAWLQSGMSDKFLVGGSEAPLTPFTIAQMKALKIYSKSKDGFPCRALDFSKTENTMILSEGASVACLELGKSKNTIATIKGIGYGTEQLKHSISISNDAQCIQNAMRMALKQLSPKDIDIVVTHTPGTIKGDLAEYKAIKRVFGDNVPALTTNKSIIGHSLGASGLLSLELAILMLKHQEYIASPFYIEKRPKQIKHIMVNAVGFGGNAVSVVVALN
jgi:3-oxoacyl-(acyl-carrier-protein) synthase